jgi:hypothetical protein
VVRWREAASTAPSGTEDLTAVQVLGAAQQQMKDQITPPHFPHNEKTAGRTKMLRSGWPDAATIMGALLLTLVQWCRGV